MLEGESTLEGAHRKKRKQNEKKKKYHKHTGSARISVLNSIFFFFSLPFDLLCFDMNFMGLGCGVRALFVSVLTRHPIMQMHRN